MEVTFNLKNYLTKTANYEGAQGYMRAQTRAWMNCSKMKMEAGSKPQEAWMSCCDEFQKGDQGFEWVGKYASETLPKLQKEGDYQLQMGQYWNQIKKKIAAGKTPGQAVMEVLEDFQKAGAQIPAR